MSTNNNQRESSREGRWYCWKSPERLPNRAGCSPRGPWGFDLGSTSRHVQLHLNIMVTLSRYGRMARGGERREDDARVKTNKHTQKVSFPQSLSSGLLTISSSQSQPIREKDKVNKLGRPEWFQSEKTTRFQFSRCRTIRPS